MLYCGWLENSLFTLFSSLDSLHLSMCCLYWGRYESLLLHNPSNPSAGYRVTLFTKLHLDFLGPIIIPTLPEYFPNFCCQTILFWYLWILNTNLNIQKIICILNTNVVCRVRRAAAEKYYDELLILEECCCVKTE